MKQISSEIDIPVRVRHAMTAPAITVEPTATVKEIAQILIERDIRCVPVVDLGDQMVGVVSEADLISRHGYPTVRSHHLMELIDAAKAEHRHHWTERAEGITAGEIMTTEIVICGPEELVSIVTRRMLRNDVRTMPVVDEGQVVGVLSRHDLLRLFDRPDSQIREQVARVLASPLWSPEGHRVIAEVRDGVVVLTGSVRFKSDVDVTASVLRQVPGVTEVVNRLVGEADDPKVVYAHDTDWR